MSYYMFLIVSKCQKPTIFSPSLNTMYMYFFFFQTSYCIEFHTLVTIERVLVLIKTITREYSAD